MNINSANIILAIFVVMMITVASIYVYNFMKLSRDEKINNIKEWLKYAVTIAEKELGKGTGQLKLRYVYNMFVERFPKLTNLITFELFSAMVDEALIWMNEQIDKNTYFRSTLY